MQIKDMETEEEIKGKLMSTGKHGRRPMQDCYRKSFFKTPIR